MAALLPTSSLSSALRQQSTSLPHRFNSSSAILSRKPFSTSSSSVSRLGQRARHETQTRQPSLSSSPSPSHLSPKSSPYTPQTTRSITVQARPPESTPTPISKPPSKPQQPSTPNSNPPKPTEHLRLKGLPYFIRRTQSNQLPVYIVTKSGGTRQQTKIQKTEGNLDALRTHLAISLGLETHKSSRSPDCFVNLTTGHVVVKGWRKPEIVKFLTDRGF